MLHPIHCHHLLAKDLNKDTPLLLQLEFYCYILIALIVVRKFDIADRAKVWIFFFSILICFMRQNYAN